jgi:dTDP-4-amino-4,6-dideoxygalactose transaminase
MRGTGYYARRNLKYADPKNSHEGANAAHRREEVSRGVHRDRLDFFGKSIREKARSWVRELMGCAHGVAVCNGSAAIDVALAACGGPRPREILGQGISNCRTTSG